MDPLTIAIVRRFFASPTQPKLRRDLARELVAGLGLAAAESDPLIDRLMDQNVICPMRVHFYDVEVEAVVEAQGVRPAFVLDCGLDRGVRSERGAAAAGP